MKKEQLTLMFPEINESAITALPDDLVVCWYPSSGPGGGFEDINFRVNNRFSGFYVLRCWKDQPSKLNPNLFIFSDIDWFEIPFTFELIYSTDFNKDLNFEKEELISPEEIDWDQYYLQELLREGYEADYKNKKAEIDRKYFEQLGKIHLIRKEDIYVLLVCSENELVYQRFIQNKIKVPLLTLNRSDDYFIQNNGINLDLLGVQEFIANTDEARFLSICDEFQVGPEFLFSNGYGSYLVNLYSRVKRFLD
jgi:hypothetical protein